MSFPRKTGSPPSPTSRRSRRAGKTSGPSPRSRSASRPSPRASFSPRPGALRAGEVRGMSRRRRQGRRPVRRALRDDSKFPIRPTDFTRGQFRPGRRPRPLPHDDDRSRRYSDAVVRRLDDDDERWAISAYVLSLSAFRDPAHQRGVTAGRAHARAAQRLRARRVREPAAGPRSDAPPRRREQPKTLVRFHKVCSEGR